MHFYQSYVKGFIEGYKQSYLLTYFIYSRKCHEGFFNFKKLEDPDYVYIASILGDSVEQVKKDYKNETKVILSVFYDYEQGLIREDLIDWDEEQLRNKAHKAYVEDYGDSLFKK